MNDRAKEIETIPVANSIEVVSFADGFISGSLFPSIVPRFDSIVDCESVKFIEAKDGRIGKDKKPWDLFDEEIVEVHDGKFGFLRGRFEDEVRQVSAGRVAFSAKGKLSNGRVTSFESMQEIHWRLREGGAVPSRSNDYLIVPDEWEVVEWIVTDAK